MELSLRPYQEKDVQFLVTRGGGLNCNEPGLGKTIESLEMCKRLQCNNILVLCPKIALGVWRDEAKKFYDWSSIIVDGTPKVRKDAYKSYVKKNIKVMVTNPSLVKLKEITETQIEWDMIIIDEIHLIGLLNHKTQTYKVIEKLPRKGLLLLTGTPIRRGPQDLYAPLHLLNPKKFPSYWPFVNKYCLVWDNGFGKEIMGKPKNPAEFKRMLTTYMVRNKKTDVLPDLPAKVRSVVPLVLEGEQKKAYKSLAKDMMLETNDDILLTPNAMTLMLRLRQLLICPKILGINDYGAGIEGLKELLEEDFHAGKSALITTPFKAAIPFIREFLEKNVPNVYIEEIHGEVKENVADVAKRWQAHKSNRKVILFTVQMGASWTATDASVCYFLGASWSSSDNIQAEDRIHRIGQKNSVEIKYLCYDDTVDDSVKERLVEKNMAEGWILQPDVVLKRQKEILKNLK